MIVSPEKMDFSSKNIIMIIQGTPGVGKTTVALSAPDVLLIDTDNGMCRVNPAHRRDASICSTFDEIKADVEAAKGRYKTIVIDTGGALIDAMKQHVVDHPRDYPGGAKRSGGISQQGFGFVKELFLSFSADLRRSFNVVFVFHETKNKDDDITTFDIVCEGSARTLVYQPADLAAHMCIYGGKRVLCFSPTDQFYAKGAYGIKGIVEVPDLKDGTPNTFLTDLFAKVRASLSDEANKATEDRAAYDAIMTQARSAIAAITTPEEVDQFGKRLKTMKHALTSESEIRAALKARCNELGLTWDKDARVWKKKDQA